MIYDYACEHCGHECELAHSMKDCDKRHPCPECQRPMHRQFNATFRVNPPADANWPMENNGLGRYCPQMEPEPTGKPTKQAHFRSRGELIEAAKRKGYEIFR